MFIRASLSLMFSSSSLYIFWQAVVGKLILKKAESCVKHEIVPAHCVIAVWFGLVAQRRVLFNFSMRDGIKQTFLLIFWDPNLNAGLICGQMSYSRIPLIRALNGKERLVIRHCYGK